MVIWLVGLSGAGKTTIGRELYHLWKADRPDTVFIDGDEIREIFKHNKNAGDYSVESRRQNAERIVALCSWLDGQGINVICSILCIFNDLLEGNRERFSNYFEAYISVPMDALEKRDIKNLYLPARSGKVRNVVGVDIPYEPPGNPDMVIDNSKDGLDVKAVASEIFSRTSRHPQ